MKQLVLVLIKGYQLVVGPFLAPRCRFYPSCSAYAAEAIGTYGLSRGGWLAVRRIGRCHPWNPGGYDPVPPAADAIAERAPHEPADSTSATERVKTRGASLWGC